MQDIPVIRSSMPPFETFCDKIRPLWDSRLLTNMGALHNEFSGMLKRYLGVENISLFVNGHLALELTLQAMELTGEVITTPFTFISTVHAIVRNNLTPVFCDINPNNFTVDASKIEKLITGKTSAIVPVHVYGYMCDVDAIQKIAEKYNLKVIYDAAHAFGVNYNGVPVGNFGDASMFSFHATKVFHSIEGGAVTTKDKGLIDKLYKLKNFGIMSEEHIEDIGANAKMNEFQAAMGICNLMTVDEEISKRKKAYLRYCERLEGIKGIYFYKAGEGQNYSYFPIVVDGEAFGISRDGLVSELKKNNIFPRKYFYPLASDTGCYKCKYPRNGTDVATRVSDGIITLPLFADITLRQADFVCDVIISKKGSQ